MGRSRPLRSLTLAALALAAIAISYTATLHREPAPPRDPNAPLLAWEPVDQQFEGCGLTCGSRSKAAQLEAMQQPGADVGTRVFCPVSGVAFKVKEDSAERNLDGHPVYFCCNQCAGYFDQHRDTVLSRRGIAKSA